jgi:hypothetical protein
MENELLMDWEYIDINPDDDDHAHLLEIGSLLLTPEMEAHQYAHLQAVIEKDKLKNQQQPTQDKWMLASANNIASSQASSQIAWQL